MQPVRALSLTFVWGLAWLLPRPASALESPGAYPECGRTPSDSEVSAAKGAFEAGQVSFHEADYARAILFWEDAFRRDCTAIALLLNLGRAYELAEQYEHGRVALETYLERSPNNPDRPAIERRIEHLRAKAEAARLAEQQAAAKKAAAEARLHQERRKETATSELEPRTQRPVWPVILTGVGVVTTGVGLGILIPGQVSVSGYITGDGLCAARNASGEYVCSPEIGSDGKEIRSKEEVQDDATGARIQRDIGIVVTSLGAATAVTGAVLWALTWREHEPRRAWTPWVGPGLAGISYSGRF